MIDPATQTRRLQIHRISRRTGDERIPGARIEVTEVRTRPDRPFFVFVLRTRTRKPFDVLHSISKAILHTDPKRDGLLLNLQPGESFEVHEVVGAPAADPLP